MATTRIKFAISWNVILQTVKAQLILPMTSDSRRLSVKMFHTFTFPQDMLGGAAGATCARSTAGVNISVFIGKVTSSYIDCKPFWLSKDGEAFRLHLVRPAIY